MSHSLLVVNSGSLWLDNVYLRLHRTTAQPRLAFVNVGSPGQEPALAVLRPARVFATNVTFQAEGRARGRVVRSAAAVATHSARSAVLLDGAPPPHRQWPPRWPGCRYVRQASCMHWARCACGYTWRLR